MKAIRGYPGYCATDEGHIWSEKSARLLLESFDTQGYYKANVQQSEENKTVSVHKLVALAYLPEPVGIYNTIDHMDGDKINNAPSNLHYISMADNIAKEQGKRYRMRHPKGHEVVIYNMAEYCRDFDLHDGHMNAVYHGKRSSHKGWTRVK